MTFADIIQNCENQDFSQHWISASRSSWPGGLNVFISRVTELGSNLVSLGSPFVNVGGDSYYRLSLVSNRVLVLGGWAPSVEDAVAGDWIMEKTAKKMVQRGGNPEGEQVL
jgi:hypothetical protein